ncbi:hypothetical protein A2Y85_02575 [candidate division WOR-3 bacterium RBG_13_43_14]|uniref:Probable chemoreceptor glutamine deamidase CheD n=1 Tax=candidate division WOR-3 bacterium RBG_13_43_14 TaxID=1802590 RepID=A0A1F4U8Y0_UNCW3|nr:MAG: hypothetical protein A2Y85_02575 [candidate division WOR-3 bacterium RBG_13_43_14]
MESLRVGIGEVKVADGEAKLVTYGIGSCVAIILYDPVIKVGGFAHCLLPFGDGPELKYPRNAINAMLKAMIDKGAQQKRIIAKIIGGATMFEGFERHSIGKRNVAQSRKILEELGVAVVAEDVFGDHGRSVELNLGTGEVRVHSYRHGEKIL